MELEPEQDRRLVSGRAFLLGGVGVVLTVALLALLWLIHAGDSQVDTAFWGTPTPTPAFKGLPF